MAHTPTTAYIVIADADGNPILDSTGAYLITGATYEVWGMGSAPGTTYQAADVVSTSWVDVSDPATTWS